jgi:hypothetical protein
VTVAVVLLVARPAQQRRLHLYSHPRFRHDRIRRALT